MTILDRYKKRLIDEWNQHQNIIIAVDYDDTLSPWKLNSEEFIKLYDRVWKLIKECDITGAFIVCHTACNPDRYDEIRNDFYRHGIDDVFINKTPVSLPYGKEGSKIYAQIFLDDRAGLLQSIEILEDALYKRRATLQFERLDYPGSLGI